MAFAVRCLAASSAACVMLAGCGGSASLPAASQVTWATPAAITFGTALSAIQLNAAASVPGTFEYTPAVGTVLGAGPQTLAVTFTPTDTKDYTTATANVTLQVNQATPVLTWATPAAIAYGTPLSASQLDAAANIAGTFAYTPGLGATFGVGPQTLSVTFTPTDTKDYTTATANVTLQVNQATPVLTWATPAAITYGTVLSESQLSAIANIPGTFIYNPPLGALLDAGSQMLSVAFTPTDSKDYTAVNAGVTLMVNPATPVLTWAAPSPIVIGVPLSSTALDAVATAPGSTAPLQGTYLYSPNAGTKFTSSGPQTLQVTFTPADSTDYTTAQAIQTQSVVPFGVVAWGDSLTGCCVVAYPTYLQSQLTLPVENGGIGGQTSAQIGVREGGVPTYATVAGGVIPASGGVTVTFPTGYEPVTSQGPSQGTTGTILGVHGTVTLDTSGVYTFTPTTPGNPVNALGSPQFVVDTPYAGYLAIFYEGRNDPIVNNQTYVPTTLDNIAAQVATVPSNQNYLVLSVPNMNTQWEQLGNKGYNGIIYFNTQLANIYGSRYLDLRKILVNSYNPALITDVSDFNNDEPPTSLRRVLGTGTLVSDIGPADTTFTINFTSNQGIGDGTIMTIDTGANAENVEITAISGNTVTVLRNFGGNDTAHAAGVAFTATDPLHFGPSGNQVVANAVAQYLSAYRIPGQ